MYGFVVTVNAMKRAFGRAIARRGMVTVVGKRLTWSECGGFPHDSLPFEDVLMSICAFDHPAPPVERDRGVREVGDGDEVDERMRRISVRSLGIVEIHEAIQRGS